MQALCFVVDAAVMASPAHLPSSRCTSRPVRITAWPALVGWGDGDGDGKGEGDGDGEGEGEGEGDGEGDGEGEGDGDGDGLHQVNRQ